MSRKNQSAGWGLRIAALALTLLAVAVVFAFRFADNGGEVQAMLWAACPIVTGLLVSMLLGKIEKLSSSKRKWQIYTWTLVLAMTGILLNTWL